ncbi:MAG: PrgI family protein [Lachnospiraceae bacterium]|nr:PrgI family protein [Lachnospiraceae bacterium]
MDRIFSKDVEKYKRKGFKGLSKLEMVFAILTVAIGSGVIYLLNYLNVPMLVSVYIGVFACAPVAFLGFKKKKGYSLFEIIEKNRELAKTSGKMPYISTEGVYFLKEEKTHGKKAKKKF